MSETCQERVNRGDGRWTRFEACGRKVKEDGLCGVHLAARKRRAEKDAERRERWDQAEALQREAAAMSRALGVEVTANYTYAGTTIGRYDGAFVVPGDWLREIVKEKAPLDQEGNA